MPMMPAAIGTTTTTMPPPQFELELEARDRMIANLKEQYQELSDLNFLLYEKLDATLVKLENSSSQVCVCLRACGFSPDHL